VKILRLGQILLAFSGLAFALQATVPRYSDKLQLVWQFDAGG